MLNTFIDILKSMKFNANACHHALRTSLSVIRRTSYAISDDVLITDIYCIMVIRVIVTRGVSKPLYLQ